MIDDGMIVRSMAGFFLRELFYNIPEVPVRIMDDMDKDTLGLFILDKGEDYDPDNDEFMNAYEYRSRYKPLWDGLGGVELGGEFSYMDPLNHPDASIELNRKILKDIRKTTAVLLHELLHYFYWYIGRGFHDDDRDFLDKCREMELPTNYDDYKWMDGRWKDVYDYTKADKYLGMYLKYLEEGAEGTGEDVHGKQPETGEGENDRKGIEWPGSGNRPARVCAKTGRKAYAKR